jgi:hypothetical protein
MTGIVIHVELIGLAKFFEFLLGFRHILRRRESHLHNQEPE